jgi:hypothetical protein
MTIKFDLISYTLDSLNYGSYDNLGILRKVVIKHDVLDNQLIS